MAGPYDHSNDRITSLILEGGRARGEAERRRAEGWGSLLQGVGQAAAGAIQQHAQEKKEQQAVQKMAVRDAAWVGYLKTGEWQKDPKAAYSRAVEVWGPQEGPKQFQALEGVSRLQQGNREQARKDLGVIAGAMDKMGEPARAEMFPQFRELVAAGLPGVDVGAAYDPEAWTKFSAIGAQFRGESVKTREVKVRNADGSESIKIVKDEPGQDFTSAAPPQKTQTVTTVDAQGRPISKAVTEADLAAGVPQYVKPDAPKGAGERMWVIRDGQPVRITEAEYRPGDLPGSTREQARPATGAERKVLQFYNRGKDALETLEAADKSGLSLEDRYTRQGLSGDTREAAGDWLPGGNRILSQDQQAYTQAQRAFTEARLRKESGAAIPDSEFENDRKTYFKVAGDSPETVAQKRAARQKVLEGIAYESGRAFDEYYGESAPKGKDNPKTERIGAGPWESKGGAPKPQKVGRFTVRVK